MANPHNPKIYNIYDHNGELVMSGLATEIADHFYLEAEQIRRAALKEPHRILREYTVVDSGETRHV